MLVNGAFRYLSGNFKGLAPYTLYTPYKPLKKREGYNFPGIFPGCRKTAHPVHILVSNLKKYLYEPDPAAIKAHLINELATKFELTTLHPQVAYLSGDKYVNTPWLKTYQILDSCPVDIPRIKKILEKEGIHRIDCKARGLTLDLHKIQKQLKSKGKNIGLVIFTWVKNKKTAIIAQYLWDFTQ
jgi:hypothetical protein